MKKQRTFYDPARVRELRESKGISVHDLAARLEIHPTTIYRAERGESVSIGVLARIARQLKVPVALLLNEEE
jgi:transcriptional regulator with XRE-family HTH domain